MCNSPPPYLYLTPPFTPNSPPPSYPYQSFCQKFTSEKEKGGLLALFKNKFYHSC